MGDSLWTRFRFLGDSGSGTWATPPGSILLVFGEEVGVLLVELGVVGQRYQAVLEVLGGATVVDVARRYGVARQTVHGWLRRYADQGLAGLVDKSSRPASCPHQMSAVVEARIVEMRRAHPGWGPRTLVYHLDREGVESLPSRSAVYRALLRHKLIESSKLTRPNWGTSKLA